LEFLDIRWCLGVEFGGECAGSDFDYFIIPSKFLYGCAYDMSMEFTKQVQNSVRPLARNKQINLRFLINMHHLDLLQPCRNES